MNFLVFLDKDDKPYALSHKALHIQIPWDVEKTHTLFIKIGEVVPGVVVYLQWREGLI